MYVLNAAFYKPALLSRDLLDLDKLSDGRLEIGLGTGYVREEFEAAELPYPSAGARVDYLRAHDDLPKRSITRRRRSSSPETATGC